MNLSYRNSIVSHNRRRPFGPLPAAALDPLINRPGMTNAKVPTVLTLVGLAIFLPVELSFYIFGFRLTAARFILLASIPFLLGILGRKVAIGRYRFVASDLFVVLTGFWLIYAPSQIDGLSSALNHSGPDVLEFCIPYMSTRLALREHGEALKFVDLLCQMIVVVALLGLLDSLTNSYLTHNLLRQLTGFNGPNINDWTDHYRFGVLRATGPIEHPILFGFICSSGLAIATNVRVSGRIFVLASCVVGAILSFSSAPLQGCLLILVLLAYAKLMGNIPFRWALLIGLTAGAVLLAVLVSNSPIGFIISHLIYDPTSGYYRYWTWQTVIPYVSDSPWHGLGNDSIPTEISHSIDSLWLVLSIHAGVPGAILVCLSLIGAASLPTNGPRVKLTEEESRLGTSLSIFIVITLCISFSVDLWGSAWILTGVLAGTRAHLGELGRLRET